MFELLSERLKNKNGEPEVYIYDDFSGEFRNQVFYIVSDVLDPYFENDHSDLWEFIHDSFAREKGLKKLGNYEVTWAEYGEHNIEYYWIIHLVRICWILLTIRLISLIQY